MQKKSNDLYVGLNKLVSDNQKKKEDNVGKRILDTHITPEYTDKQSTLINVSDIYSAPKKWNFYDPLDDNKKVELMESIEDNGILSPIVVWETTYDEIEDEYIEDEIDVYDFEGNKFLVLAGHNRADAYKKLYTITKDSKYLKIPAFIFTKNELTIELAKEIVVDTNYVQRVLSTREMEMSILYKYNEIEKDKIQKGRTRDIVADALGVSSAKVSQYKKLSTMYGKLKDMVYEDKIALTSLLKLSDKTLDMQKKIYETYGENINNKVLNKIKPYMNWREIQSLFDNEIDSKSNDIKKISIDVPSDLVEEFKSMCSKWIYEKKKRNCSENLQDEN